MCVSVCVCLYVSVCRQGLEKCNIQCPQFRGQSTVCIACSLISTDGLIEETSFIQCTVRSFLCCNVITLRTLSSCGPASGVQRGICCKHLWRRNGGSEGGTQVSGTGLCSVTKCTPVLSIRYHVSSIGIN